jgi:hypothetical protein
VGIGFETDLDVDSASVVRFSGSQVWGIDGTSTFDETSQNISFPIGRFVTGNIQYIILVLDNDKAQPSDNDNAVTFSNITLKNE